MVPGRLYERAEITDLFQRTNLEKYTLWRKYIASKPGLSSLVNPRGVYQVLLLDRYGRDLIKQDLSDETTYLSEKLREYSALTYFFARIERFRVEIAKTLEYGFDEPDYS